MRIAINAFAARQGGGQTYLRNLFAHLPARNDLEVLVLGGSDLGLAAHPAVRHFQPRWPTANPLLRALWERVVLPRWLKHERVDLLFCPGGLVPAHTPATCRTVTMFRNLLPFDARLVAELPWGYLRLRLMALRRAMLASMARADLTIFISEHARRVIEALVLVPAAITIAHGIGETFRTAGRAPARPADAPSREYLLYVSRFDPYKRHAELVRAYASLEEPLRRRHPLLLLGETDLVDAARCAQLVRDLGLEGQVFMPGVVPHADLPAYYRHAHVVVFVSACENCPNILLEALAAGRPIVCSDVPPMPDFGGEDLIYCSPHDPASIAAAMRTALLDEPRALRAAAGALERSRHFDWARTAAETWGQLFALGDAAALRDGRACHDVATASGR